MTQEKILSALKLVELDQVINLLPEGIENLMPPSGYPFLDHEILRLKLAVALASTPKILVITEIFDLVPLKLRSRILRELCKIEDMILVYFTRLKEEDCFHQYLFFHQGETQSFSTVESFQKYQNSKGEELKNDY